MIKYNLICKCRETFESWFSSSSEFDSLCKRKLIKCIYCESTSVRKMVMAPNLSSKSNKVFKKTKLEKNCKNVGENFTQEARNIHYDKKTSKGIYGKATAEETSELLEEGIEVATIPWIDKSEH